MTLSDARDIGAILEHLITVVVVPWMAFTVQRVKHNTNGLVKHNEEMAHAAGKAEEKAEQKERTDGQ